MQALTGDNSLQFFFAVAFSQGAQTDKSFLFLSFERRLLSISELKTLISQSLNKVLKTLRLLFQYCINGFAKIVTLGTLLGRYSSFLTLSIRFRSDDGQSMLQTNHITKPLNGQTGKEEILKLTTGIQRGRIIDDMVVYVGFVDVGGNDKSVFAFRPSHRRFIAYLICFFWCDLTGFERLANLIGDDVVLLLSASGVLILPFGKKKFFIGSLRITLIGTDKFAVIGFRCILRIIGSISQTLSDSLSFVYMERNQPCCCHSHHILSKRKSHPKVTSSNNLSQPNKCSKRCP